MRAWQPGDWQAVIGALVTLVGAIAAATIAVIKAIQGQAEQTRTRIDEHEENSQTRARELRATVERHVS